MPKDSSLVGLTGFALVVAGSIFVGTPLLPARFGDVEWELTALGQVSATSATLLIGLVMLGTAAAASGRLGLAALVGFAKIVLGSAFLFFAVIVAAGLPLVWKVSAGGGAAEQQLRLLALKSGALLTCYALGSGIIGGIYVRAYLKKRTG